MSDDIAIPRWFIRLASLVLVLAVPWSGWVTLELATIRVRVDALAGAGGRVEAHLDNPHVHHAGISRLGEHVDALEQRIDRLERAFDAGKLGTGR